MNKYREGVIWGTMIGAFGGIYAMRKKLYAPVPPNFIVDDFFLTMQVLEKKKQAINELQAVCYEDVSNKLSEEFRRKVRISSGNFQNLSRFAGLLFPPTSGLAFSFLSHKVLRWLGPLFIVFTELSAIALGVYVFEYRVLAAFGAATFLLPLIDWVLQKLGAHISVLRFITHFYSMNLALFLGLIRYFRGIKTDVWTPTQRNQ
jgi:hypothetical protein